MMDWRPLRALYRLQICIYLFPIIHWWQWLSLHGATCSSGKIPVDTPGPGIEQRLCFEQSTFWSLYHIWRRTERKVNAPSYYKKPFEVVQVSVRMPQQHLPLEISLILPRGKRSCGRPRNYWRDYMFDPVWVELDSVTGWRDVWNTLLSLLQQWPIWKWKKILKKKTGWMEIKTVLSLNHLDHLWWDKYAPVTTTYWSWSLYHMKHWHIVSDKVTAVGSTKWRNIFSLVCRGT